MTNHKKSKIFTDLEIKRIEEFKSGNRSDKGSVFFSRIKPKIKELLSEWIPRKQELEDLIKSKAKK